MRTHIDIHMDDLPEGKDYKIQTNEFIPSHASLKIDTPMTEICFYFKDRKALEGFLGEIRKVKTRVTNLAKEEHVPQNPESESSPVLGQEEVEGETK